MTPKIIAMYLPQFHQIPENDEFWGKGFTDWVTVKNAKPLFKDHRQPRVPLNDNYYDLSLKENVEWQCKLAKEYGIYGFGIYHYWFNNEKNLLTKPAEIILNNKDIDINYCYAWDNVGWKRSWSNVEAANDWAPSFDNEKDKGPAVLVPYVLGTEDDWRKHFEYLLPFFSDNRYIKKDGKPVFMIYHCSDEIMKMCDYWNLLAKEKGFDGVFFIFHLDNNVPQGEYVFKYEPSYSWMSDKLIDRVRRKMQSWFCDNGGVYFVFDYNKVWSNIINNAKNMPESKVFHGGFVSFDDSPRRGVKARIVKNSSPSKFEKYLLKLLNTTKIQNKEFLFLTAWNEWGEGCYLEPDSDDKYEYLEALSRAVKKSIKY